MDREDKMLSCALAAEQLNFSASYIRRLCALGKINARKYGHDWIIPISELRNIKRMRKPKRKE